jgi:PKD repeat protein
LTVGGVSVEAAQRLVFAGGTSAAGDLTYDNTQFEQAMLDSSCGDEIILQNNFTYVGTFTMPDRGDCSSDPITIRSGVDASGNLTPRSSYPADAVRITPAYHALLAKLKTNVNNSPALNTVTPGGVGSFCPAAPCKARGYVLRWLEFNPNAWASNSMLYLGTNTTGVTDTQDRLAEVPGPFVVDQCIFKGHDVYGQKRAVAVYAKNVTIKNSYFYDIKGVGSDGQAVFITNTPGPIVIENNYMQAHTENILVGGDTPRMNYSATVLASPAPTLTSARLSHATDLFAGQWISIMVGGVKRPTKVLTISGTDITFGDDISSPALPGLPDVSGTARWSTISGNIIIRKNHLTKNLAWKDPIVPTPTGLTATGASTGGTLTAGSYGYKVTAQFVVTEAALATSSPTAEIMATIANGMTGSVKLNWAAVPNAKQYRVYGRTPGGQSVYFTTANNSFTDTGAAGTAGTPPTTGTKWIVKNLLELKECDNCLIEGNLLEHNWNPSGGSGTAVWMKVVNQNGDNDSTLLRNVTFRYNMIRHAAGGFILTSMDVESGGKPSGVMENFTISHNLLYDIGSPAWGAAQRGVYMTIGQSPVHLWRTARNLTIEHNTFAQLAGSSFFYWVLNPNGGADFYPMVDLVVRNNMGRRTGSGFLQSMAGGEGLPTWNAITTYGDNSKFERNLITDVTVTYPNHADNFFPTTAAWQGQFENYGGNNYRLLPTSPYATASTTGGRLGADIDTVEDFVTVAESGIDTATGGSEPHPANQAPAAVPGGPYLATTLSAVALDGLASSDPDGTIVSYVWSWSDGCSDTSGPSVTHTFSRSGGYTATLTVTDDQGLSASARTAVTIVNRPPTAVAGGPYAAIAGATVAVSGSGSADADGSISSYRWSWGDGSAGLVSATPNATHVYVSPGDYQITLTVTDDEGSTATSTTSARIGTQSPTIAVSATSVAVGALVTATLTNAPGGVGDWLALAAANAPNTSYLQFTYVGTGMKTLSWTVAMPSVSGTYQFRLFAKNGYTRLATSVNVVVSPAPPVLTSVLPPGAAPGSPGFTLTANGSGFTSASLVRWNGASRATTFVSATQLRASISSADLVAAGAAQITVFTPSAAGGATSAPVPFVIGTFAPALQVSATSANAGDQVMVTLTNGYGGSKDWLSFAPTGAPNTSYPQFTYVGAGLTTRTWLVTMPATAGAYEFRLFIDDSYTRVATSAAVTVKARVSPPALNVSATRVAPGGQVTVTLTDGYGDPADWLALSATTASNGSYVQYIYVGPGVTTRTWTVSMPATAGTYEFRLFLKGTYTRAATSPSVTVSP